MVLSSFKLKNTLQCARNYSFNTGWDLFVSDPTLYHVKCVKTQQSMVSIDKSQKLIEFDELN